MEVYIKNAETLKKMIMEYLEIGDSYTYQLTRIKAAFVLGTMSVDAFEEWTEDDVDALVSHIIRNSVHVPPHGNLIEKYDVFRLISEFPEIDKLLPVQFMQALYNLPTVIPAEEDE